MPESGADKPSSKRERKRFFEREVLRLTDRLYGTALRLTRDPSDAEDVVAEAVQRAWSKLDELRDVTQLEAWLFRILNNTFVDTWRRRRSRQNREVALESGEPEGQDGVDFALFEQLHQPFLLWWGTPEERVLENLLRQDIQQALDALSDEFRLVIMLVEVQGYSYQETAEQLEVPVGTVRSRLNRARSMLQKSLWNQAREMGIVHGEQGESRGPHRGKS